MTHSNTDSAAGYSKKQPATKGPQSTRLWPQLLPPTTCGGGRYDATPIRRTGKWTTVTDYETVPVTGVDLHRDTLTGEYLCHYIGVHSRRAVLLTRQVTYLGFSFKPHRTQGPIADLMLGYLSGFPLRAIAWYLLTRSLPPKRWKEAILRWEARTGKYDGRLRKVLAAEPMHLYDVIAKEEA